MRSSVPLVVVFLLALPLSAEPEVHLLWPEGAPGAWGDAEQDRPRLLVYRVDGTGVAQDNATSAAVVVCPGGGYGNLAMGHEGHEIAAWLNSFGVTAGILEYRHRGKGYGHPAPLQDAQRAVRVVRHHAALWKLDPHRIGVMGFSAGGHLASSVSTHFDHGQGDDKDPVERQSCRPDFAILCYPVIAFGEPYTHRGSQRNLLGQDADAKLLNLLSNEKQVTAETPPTFLWHTAEDRAVPAENSVVYYLALRAANVPSELHVFQAGRHGLGLAKNTPGARRWPDLCRTWLEQQILRATHSER